MSELTFPKDFINRIINGDCLEVMKDIPNESIDMILCDLPYGIIDCEWDKTISIDELWNEYPRIISDVGSIVLFSSGKFTSHLIRSDLEMFKYKYVWIKNNTTNFVHAKNRPLSKHEDILVFSKAPMGHKSLLKEKRMVYNPQGLIERKQNIKSGKRRFGTYIGNRPSHKKEFERTHTNYPTDVLMKYPEPSANTKLHTSQKPVALCEFLIKTYTNENDIVLDNCIGSGTTAVACKKSNRKFIGIEIDSDYCDIANQRLKKTKLSEPITNWIGF